MIELIVLLKVLGANPDTNSESFSVAVFNDFLADVICGNIDSITKAGVDLRLR